MVILPGWIGGGRVLLSGFFQLGAAEFRKGGALGRGEDTAHACRLLQPVVAEKFDPLFVGDILLLVGAVRLGDKFKAPVTDFFNGRDLALGQAEFFLELRRDEHRVAEELDLQLVEALKLGGGEEGEGFRVVAVDEREEALVGGEALGFDLLAIFNERVGAGF